MNEDPHKAIRMRLRRFRESGDPRVVLDRRVEREVLELRATSTAPDQDHEIRYTLGWLHWSRHLALGQERGEQDLLIATRLLAEVYQVEPEAVPKPLQRRFAAPAGTTSVVIRTATVVALDTLSRAVRSRDLAVIDRAVAVGRAALTTTPENDLDRASLLSCLANVLAQRAEQTRDLTTWSAAIENNRAAVAASGRDDPDHPTYLSNLGVLLRKGYDRTGDARLLDEAVTIGWMAVDRMSHDHPDRAVITANLGDELHLQYNRTGQLALLRDAIAMRRAAVQATPMDHALLGERLSDLGCTLWQLFIASDDDTALAEAIRTGRAAVAAAPVGTWAASAARANLSAALQLEYSRTNNPDLLAEAIAIGRAGVDATPMDHPQRVTHLATLGAALQIEFSRTSDPATLAEAVHIGLAVVAISPPASPATAGHLSNLGGALRAQAEQTGDMAMLRQAVDITRQAVAHTVPGYPGRASVLTNLSAALRTESDWTGELDVLDEAIAVGQAAVDAGAADHSQRAIHLMSLVGALHRRVELTRDVAAATSAVVLARDAVRIGTTAGHPNLHFYLMSLSSALLLRCALTNDFTDAPEAIANARAAVSVVTDTDHPNRAGHLANLGLALQQEFCRTGEPAMLAEAIDLGRAAVAATPAGHSSHAPNTLHLSRALVLQYGRDRRPALIAEALNLARSAARTETGTPMIRVEAANTWGLLAGHLGEYQSAADGFATAVQQLQHVAARRVGRHTAEHLLTRFAGLAGDAAAFALTAGSPDRAVALLEMGRGILLAQALDTRTDLTDLQERAPDLADRFTWLCAALDTNYDSGTMPAASIGPFDGATAESSVVRRHQLVDELAQVTTAIRQLPMMERFLLPPQLSELLVHCDNGPVVLINVSDSRCDALILTKSGITVRPLPQLTKDDIKDRVTSFLSAHDPRLGVGQRVAAEQTVRDTLAWLWDTVAAPVLTTLGITGTPRTEAEWPRVWWAPGGLLSLLPIHAAGYHDERTHSHPRTVLDRVMSSYTPTVRTIAHARGRNHRNVGTEVVAVVMRCTPGAADLPAAQGEAKLIRSLFPGATTFTDAEARRDVIVSALGTAQWAHFACHGSSDLDNPSNSCLALHDQPLDVTAISRLRLRDAELAFLSACATTQTKPELADEAIHITTAFQLAGYRHVIGTLWAVHDRIAAEITARVYRDIASSTPDADRAAGALHRATRILRDRYPDTPTLWAAHIHVGG